MIWIILFVVLLAVCVCCVAKSDGCNDIFEVAGTISFILTGLMFGGLLLATVICTVKTLFNLHGLDQCDRNIKIANRQYDNQVEVIRSRVEKYPVEENILKDLNPSVLLKLPEIKSNELLKAEIQLAVKYRDQIYKWKYQKSQFMKNLDVLGHFWLVPKFCSAKYRVANG